MHIEALAHTPTAGEIQECRSASTTQNTPPTSMISVSHLETGPHQWCFIASHKRLVVWWPGEGILCWHISMTSFSSNQPNVCAKVTFDTLSLGFTVNWSKVVYTAQCLIFLGVEIDTVQFELRLSDDRVSVLSLLKVTNSKRICTKLHLQRLLGKLNSVASVVRGVAHFWGVLLPWQTRINALAIASI